MNDINRTGRDTGDDEAGAEHEIESQRENDDQESDLQEKDHPKGAVKSKNNQPLSQASRSCESSSS